MFENYNDVLTVQDTMELLYIGKNSCYQLLKSGELAAFRIGHNWKIPKSSVVDYIERKCSIKHDD